MAQGRRPKTFRYGKVITEAKHIVKRRKHQPQSAVRPSIPDCRLVIANHQGMPNAELRMSNCGVGTAAAGLPLWSTAASLRQMRGGSFATAFHILSPSPQSSCEDAPATVPSRERKQPLGASGVHPLRSGPQPSCSSCLGGKTPLRSGPQPWRTWRPWRLSHPAFGIEPSDGTCSCVVERHSAFGISLAVLTSIPFAVSCRGRAGTVVRPLRISNKRY